MKANFANIDMYDRPILILKRADGTPIGVLGNATNVEVNPKYNELSILSFTLPSYVDGQETPFYDDVNGQMIVELKDIAQFVVSQPEESGEKINVHKTVQANSLECEFARKKITLPESTYKFFDSSNTDGTVLGMIMELMPNWTVGSVASSLYNKYRTFEVNGENLYNFIKGTVQKAYNCIFDFDTLTRSVSVRDADDTPAQKQVFISRDNLAKDIKVTEKTDDMVTRLEANGADGVDIREVNPTGTNYILNLDYFMTTKNFSSALVEKYGRWKELIESNRAPFYNYSIQYSMRVSEELAENAKLADLQGEYTVLENIQAVVIQGISQQIKDQTDLDNANRDLRNKQAEIDAKQAEINSIAAEREDLMNKMKAIRNTCAYENYFTLAERKQMDAYIIDNSISESSFVASEVQSYTDGAGNSITNKTIRVTGSDITESQVTDGSTVLSTLYSLTGGSINIASGLITGTVISSVFERRNNGKIVLSVYISNGSYNGTSFPSGCVSISGEGTISKSGTTITATVPSNKKAYLFFSLNASEYEKRTVAWDLYEYAETILRKMAVPSYSFSVSSANFIALEPFELFKNELELGQRIYIQIGNGQVLKPICTGAKLKYGDRPYLELQFNDTFTANDGEAKLIDILDNSITMGKTLSSGKFTYEAWTDSGASSELKEFILSALDTAKNAIMSSTEQAVSWDGAGLRLRKWSNTAHTGYEGEQIWINNNSIMMTDDSWAHAKMAIGKIHDDNVGDKWGIIAELVVGTMIAGTELVIESQKKSGSKTGDTSVFRMDADGCRLYNADFQIQKQTGSTTTQILLDPSVGVAMGTYPLKNADGTINTTNAKFYVDTDGTMTLAGTIYTYKGIIGGWTISQDGLYSGTTDATSVGMTSSGNVRIWSGKKADNDTDRAKAPFYVKQDGFVSAIYGKIGGWYIGDKSNTYYIGNADSKAKSTVGMYSSTTDGDVVFWAGDKLSGTPKFKVTAGGALTSISGNIGGWYIGTDYIGNESTKATSTVGLAFSTSSSAYTFWSGGTQTGTTTGKDGVASFRVRVDGHVEAADLIITGGSITIKSGDTETFKVTSEGFLTAIYGKVGGWYIGDKSSTYYIGNAASKADSTVGMYSSNTTSDVVFWAGGKLANTPLFRVTAGGTIYAIDAQITGGKIGGWYIKSDYIGSADEKATSAVGLANVTGGNIAFWAGNSGGDPAGANFRVQANGTVWAANLNITGGSITITSGGATTFSVSSAGRVDATDLHITGGSITISTVFSVDSNGYLTSTSGKIGGWYIGSDYLGNGSQKNTSRVGIASSTTITDVAFWAGGDGSHTPDITTNKANFMVTVGGAVYAKELHITGGDINIASSAGTVNFSVSNEGVLTAKSGSIGGWYFLSDYLGNANTKAGSSVGLAAVADTSDSPAFWAGKANPTTSDAAPFMVTGKGILYATGAIISGDLTSETGKIGGWYINATQLHSATVYLDSGTETSIWAGNADPSLASFSVSASGHLVSKDAYIGGWTVSSDWLYTGSGTNCVCLNGVGTYAQTWALWCGADWPETRPYGSGSEWAPFRVTRTGDVYINALMVWDGTTWKKIDFSGNFKNAVSLKGQYGRWDGNTFIATVVLFDKIEKELSISASYQVAVDGIYKGFNKNNKRITFSIDVNHTVNGVSTGDKTVADRGMDIDDLYDIIWQYGKDDTVSGANVSAGLQIASDSKSYDYRGIVSGSFNKTGDWQNTGTKVYENGVAEGESHFEKHADITPIGSKAPFTYEGYKEVFSKSTKDGVTTYTSLGTHYWYYWNSDGSVVYYDKGTAVTGLYTKK